MVAWFAPVAIAAGSAIAQWLNSKSAQGASAEERARMEALLAKIKQPQFDPTTLTPEDYKVAATYVPQAATYIQEKAPEVVKMASEDAKLAKSAMRDALAKLQAGANDTTMADIERQTALADAAGISRSAQGSIAQEMQARGMGGSGQEMLARQVAAQAGGQRAAQTSAQAVADAYRQKLNMIMNSANLGGQIADREYKQEAGNVDIRNSFNAREAAARQNWEDNRSNVINDATRYNVTNTQDVANKNVAQRNVYQTSERNRLDANKQNEFQNALDVVRAQSGNSENARRDIAGERDATAGAISGIAGAGMTAYDAYQGDETAEKKKKKKKNSYTGSYGTYGEEV